MLLPYVEALLPGRRGHLRAPRRRGPPRASRCAGTCYANLFPWPLDKQAFLDRLDRWLATADLSSSTRRIDPRAARRRPPRPALPKRCVTCSLRSGVGFYAFRTRTTETRRSELGLGAYRTRTTETRKAETSARLSVCRVRGCRALSPSCWTPTDQPADDVAADERGLHGRGREPALHVVQRPLRLRPPVTISRAWKPGSQSTSTDRAGIVQGAVQPFGVRAGVLLGDADEHREDQPGDPLGVAARRAGSAASSPG